MKVARLLATWLVLGSSTAAAQSEHDDPYAYGLRLGVFPAHFQAGVSQSHFGSTLRAELDVVRGLAVDAAARVGWANVAGEKDPISHLATIGVTWTFSDEEEVEPLSGTVYPEDTPMIRGSGSGVDDDLELPISQRLGGPRMTLPEKDRSLKAPMRNVRGLRLGYAHARAVEDVRPGEGKVLNELHLVYAGFTWGSHWNLSPSAAGGERELGHKRFYVDALLTLKALSKRERLFPADDAADVPRDFLPLGLRVGLSGAIDALVSSAPGIGFGYQLELGALPGESGVEGYLFVALGLELDVRTRSEPLRKTPSPNSTKSQVGAPAVRPGARTAHHDELGSQHAALKPRSGV